MPRQDSRQTLSLLCCLTLLAGGLLVSSGCAHRPGGEEAFRRFWGFEPHANARAGHGPQGQSGGLIPKLFGPGSGPSGGPQDPFLAQNFGTPGVSQTAASVSSENNQLAEGENPSAHSGTTAQTLFESPSNQTNVPSEAQAGLAEGNPFRLVQHQANVTDVSSADKRPQQPIVTPRQSANAPSQLDRLKNALSRDAETPAPVRPSAESAEVNRQRVEAMMKTARRHIELGEYESALKWVTAAEELARRAELFFGPDEDPPADLERILEDRLKGSAADLETTPPAPQMPIIQPQPLETPGTPTLSIEFPDEDVPSNHSVENFSPEVVPGPSSLPHSTQAMKRAVIGPEPTTSLPNDLVAAPGPPDPAVQGSEAGSLNGDSRRVGVNQGAAVSVEGPLEVPMGSPPLPVPLAPPAMEVSQLPPLELAMSEPAKSSPGVPSLPSPSSVQGTSQPNADPPGLYSESSSSAPTTLKNVDWDETEEAESAQKQEWWIMPACVLAGIAFVAFLLLKRKRA